MPSSSVVRSPDRRGSVGQDHAPSPGHPVSRISTRDAPVRSGSGGDPGDEHSPLLSPSDSFDEAEGFIPARQVGSGGSGAALDDDESRYHSTKTIWYLILLTISIGGLQLAWSVELSNGSPYLLSLGLSKSVMALVWIAGPLTGTIVQPYVGMLSDSCRISWGKRKPFMLGGAAATILSLMVLAWTREIVTGILSLFGADPDSKGVKICIMVAAVLWIYVLDFAINTVQAAIRAFIVDCCPPHQQEAANAMASRIIGIGNIIGYVAGYTNLPSILGFLGHTQFQILCAIASIGLGVTVILSTAVIPERNPLLDGPPAKGKQRGVIAFFSTIFRSIRRLPPQTKKVCQVQFFAWIGFFPMLFYTSSYIGEIYVEPKLQANPHMTPEELDTLYEEATRVGTFALLVYSITSLTTNVILPFLIAPTHDTREPGSGPVHNKDFDDDGKKSWLDRLVIPGLTLRRAWMVSLLLFTGAMFCTVLVRSVPAATALIGLVGITWALTLWAPFAIISAEISRRDAAIRARKLAKKPAFSLDTTGDAGGLGDNRCDSLHEYSPEDQISNGNGDSSKPTDVESADDEEVDQAGIILGIHNMAIAAPQIIATVVSSIVFKIFQKPRGTPGDHSIAIVMALGGVTVLIAAWMVHGIDDAPQSADPEHHGQGNGETDEDDDVTGLLAGRNGEPSARPRPERQKSGMQTPRQSLDRATLVRNSSFGGGLEY